ARDGIDIKLPQPTHSARDDQDGRVLSLFDLRLPPHVSAGAVLADLDVHREPARDEVVAGKWGHLLPEIPPGDNYLYLTAHKKHPKPLFKWRSKYWSFLLKLSPERPAWTIQATPGPYIGPFHWRNRRLSVAETKRLMTFPDDYELPGSRTVWQKLLGNAVACKLAEVLGRSILQQLGLRDQVEDESDARAAAAGAAP